MGGGGLGEGGSSSLPSPPLFPTQRSSQTSDQLSWGWHGSETSAPEAPRPGSSQGPSGPYDPGRVSSRSWLLVGKPESWAPPQASGIQAQTLDHRSSIDLGESPAF